MGKQILLFLLVFVVGCANQVTVPTTLKTIELTIGTEGPTALEGVIYYFVLDTSGELVDEKNLPKGPRINGPIPNRAPDLEGVLPFTGQIVEKGELPTTWTEYFGVKKGSIGLTGIYGYKKVDGTIEEIPTQNFQYKQVDPTHMRLSIPFSILSTGEETPDQLTFNLAVATPNGEIVDRWGPTLDPVPFTTTELNRLEDRQDNTPFISGPQFLPVGVDGTQVNLVSYAIKIVR